MNKDYKKWFENGGREVRQKYNKEYSARPEVIEKARLKNARPDQRLNRKHYKQTPAAKISNLKYVTKPETVEKIRKNRLKRLYNFTAEEYDALYIKQGGRCAICTNHFEKLDVDHCHKTNKVRGLLCGACNRALGLMKDNTEFLLKAIEYLNHG